MKIAMSWRQWCLLPTKAQQILRGWQAVPTSKYQDLVFDIPIDQQDRLLEALSRDED